jgi:hypothetical protein
MRWTVETHGWEVGAEIAALPADMQYGLIALFDRVEEAGLSGLLPKAVKHL